jgi:hypothetical protein
MACGDIPIKLQCAEFRGSATISEERNVHIFRLKKKKVKQVGTELLSHTFWMLLRGAHELRTSFSKHFMLHGLQNTVQTQL